MKKYYSKSIWLILQLIATYGLTQALVTGSDIITNSIDNLTSGDLYFEQVNMTLLLFIILVGFICAFFKSFFGSKLSLEIACQLKSDLTDKILKLKSEYFINNSSGAIINKLMGDIGHIERLLGELLPQFLTSILTIIIIGLTIFQIDSAIGIVMIICSICILIITTITSKRLKKLTKTRRGMIDALLSHSSDFVRGVQTGRAYNLYKIMTEKLMIPIDGLFQNEKRRVKVSSVAWFLQIFAEWLPGFITIWFVVNKVIDNSLSIGNITYLLLMLNRFFKPFSELPTIINDSSEIMVSVRRVKNMLESPEENDNFKNNTINNLNKISIRNNNIAVELSNATFSYTNETRAWSNINIDIKNGEEVALVGSSGSGKSTIFNILCGFYNLQEGEYKLFGTSSKSLSLKSIRKQFSIVSQDIFLFPGTIKENVCAGQTNISDYDIIKSCKAADIHEVIMNTPNGYDTVLGEDGVGLSGGEKQRLSIARALLKNSPILLLDEPTSALDVETEKQIQKTLRKIKGNKTIITIAHRLSTIKHSDRIIVLSNGHIAEIGTDKTLMQNQGVYYNLNQMDYSGGHN
jgi:ABC-type multidrug transport system, ATPase and permease components